MGESDHDAQAWQEPGALRLRLSAAFSRGLSASATRGREMIEGCTLTAPYCDAPSTKKVSPLAQPRKGPAAVWITCLDTRSTTSNSRPSASPTSAATNCDVGEKLGL